ncbi:MAG: 3-deoxy-7-phosphoheptulonate synthase [Candidatus Ancaeobacter aquaticus]|nr:3-deoxy-7-phosphoheptulonate synthase [Candidatus Ancaeobacter aquaticus]
MIIVLRPGAKTTEKKHIIKKMKEMGFQTMVSEGLERTIIGLIGEEDLLRTLPIEAMPGVERVMQVLKPYKLVSREFKPADTVVKAGNVRIGGKKIVVAAGPCAVEDKDSLLHIGKEVKKAGAVILRGGAFKPRSSPYAFQGLGEEGLKYLQYVREKTGLLVVSEVMDTRDVALVEDYVDIIQIGARNMQNFNLLKEVGLAKKPILLKRGLMATVKEFLMSAEYILSQGNFNVILCERGIRTFEDSTRNTLDVSAIPVIKSLSHLPVIVDPSHAAGKWEYVSALSKAAVAAGADGLIVEVHHKPEDAMSDGEQSLLPKTFSAMMKELKPIAVAIKRTI